ncbi:MAG: hypothetical protein WBQ59_05010, partial [Candidatus Acidiferrum sp.]
MSVLSVFSEESRAAAECASDLYSYLAFSLRGRGIDEEMFSHVLGEETAHRLVWPTKFYMSTK